MNIRCLVIQLGPPASVLQSLMAMRAVQQLYPMIEFSIVVRERASDISVKVPWLQKIYDLKECHMEEGVSGLARWIAPMVKESWDFVINWSFNESSSFLTSLIPAKFRLGFARGQDNSMISGDDWSGYIHAWLRGSFAQNIHFTDIFTTQLLTALQIHGFEPKASGESFSNRGMFQLDLDQESRIWNSRSLLKKWIAIDLADPGSLLQWDFKAWAQFLSRVLSKNSDINVFVLGESSHEDLYHQIVQEMDVLGINTERLVSILDSNQKSFDILASVISRSQWLFSHSPFYLQLASIAGTRSIGMVQELSSVCELGPYGNGHYLIQKNYQDLKIHPDWLFSIWEYAVSDWSGTKERLLETFPPPQIFQIFRSRIRPTHEGGGVLYEPLLPKNLGLEEWTSKVMGQIVRSWFCGWTAPTGQELDRKAINGKLLTQMRSLQKPVHESMVICKRAIGLLTLLRERSKRLKNAHIMSLEDRNEIQAMWADLESLQLKIGEISQKHLPLRAFDKILAVQMNDLRGENLTEMCSSGIQSFKLLVEGCEILEKWLKHTIGLGRPMPVKEIQL